MHDAPTMMHNVRLFARHYTHQGYHALHRFGVPSHLIPDTFLVLVGLVLTVWIVLHVLVGTQAQRKGQSFWYGFLFALLTTPIIASLYVAFLRPLKTTTRKSPRKRPSFSGASGSRDRERVA